MSGSPRPRASSGGTRSGTMGPAGTSRERRARRLPSVLATGGCLIVLAACPLAGERQVNTYESVAAARAAGLFERGWLPDLIPDGAGPVVEAHDVDTGARCSRTGLSPGDAERVVAALTAAGFEALTTAPPPRPDIDCPFTMPALSGEHRTLWRSLGERAEREIARVEGTALYFWSVSDRP